MFLKPHSYTSTYYNEETAFLFYNGCKLRVIYILSVVLVLAVLKVLFFFFQKKKSIAFWKSTFVLCPVSVKVHSVLGCFYFSATETIPKTKNKQNRHNVNKIKTIYQRDSVSSKEQENILKWNWNQTKPEWENGSSTEVNWDPKIVQGPTV